MEDFIGKYNGGQIESRLDKVKDMVGATASVAGTAGLVPAPAAGKQASFLRGDVVALTVDFITSFCMLIYSWLWLILRVLI